MDAHILEQFQSGGGHNEDVIPIAIHPSASDQRGERPRALLPVGDLDFHHVHARSLVSLDSTTCYAETRDTFPPIVRDRKSAVQRVSSPAPSPPARAPPRRSTPPRAAPTPSAGRNTASPH